MHAIFDAPTSNAAPPRGAAVSGARLRRLVARLHRAGRAIPSAERAGRHVPHRFRSDYYDPRMTSADAEWQ